MKAEDPEFKQSMLEQFFMIKSLREAESFPLTDLKRGLRSHWLGCFLVPLTLLLDRYAKNIVSKEVEKRHFDDHRTKADAVLRDERIRRRICSAFQDLPKDKIVTEDAFVEVVCRALSRAESSDEVYIPNEASLRAMIAYQIFIAGIEKFCSNTRT
jgi:hypothetical protein